MANEESTTLQNILAAGKEEFLEKGFKYCFASQYRQNGRSYDRCVLRLFFRQGGTFCPLLLKNMQRL